MKAELLKGKELLQALPRVYLDTADIIVMADGRVPERDIERLVEALKRTRSLVVWSTNHAWDYYPETDAATRERMVEAVNRFPHIAVAMNEPPHFEPYALEGEPPDLDLGYTNNIRELMEDPRADESLKAVKPMKALFHNAEQASLEAARVFSEVKFKKQDFQMYVGVFVSLVRGKNGTTAEGLLDFWEERNGQTLEPVAREAIRSQLAPMAEMFIQAREQWPEELDGDDLIARVLQNEQPDLCRTAPGLFLQRALRNGKRSNIRRNSKPSDMVDLAHVQYIPYVDVFTTDRENVAVLSRVLKEIKPRRASRVLRVRQFSALADVVDEVCGAIQVR